jgi:acetoin utilization protein AcuC
VERENERGVEGGVGIVDGRKLPSYDLGTGHPFARDRLVPLMELLEAHRLVEAGDFLAVAPASDRELRLAHKPGYLEALAALSVEHPSAEWLRRAPGFGLGTADNPIAPGQERAARAVAGATSGCVRAVMDGAVRRAFCPPGGLHHALAAAASGFCLVNDLVIGIREAKRLGARRVLYVDLDVHHGDGVELAFVEDAEVFTFSIHQHPATLWPGTGWAEERGRGAGAGTVCNVPVDPGTGDEGWLGALREALPPFAERCRPDLIVSQHGCDPHREDPLAALAVTTRGFLAAAELVRDLAVEHCGGRWVATGGGGYQPYRVIPRAWTIVWCVLSGRELPEQVDPDWRRRWESRSGTALPARFLD